MRNSIIELKSADLTLGNAAASVHVLKSIDLSIAESEAVGIVGPSGSGKSTLLMVLAGLERLDSGEIHVRNTPLHTLSEDRLADFRGKNIGIVFQSFHLIANLTALENVMLPLELAGQPDARSTADVAPAATTRPATGLCSVRLDSAAQSADTSESCASGSTMAWYCVRVSGIGGPLCGY